MEQQGCAVIATTSWRTWLALSLALNAVLCVLGIAYAVLAYHYRFDDSAGELYAIKAKGLLGAGLTSTAIGLGGWFGQREHPSWMADLAVGMALTLSILVSAGVMIYLLLLGLGF